jgi:two-component system, cell cycle sensor histidine kinase and response regulator CckA
MKHKYPSGTLDRLTVVSTEERSQWLTQIFQHSNEAIFLIDLARDKILEVNPKACQLLQYEARELLSLSVSTLYPHQKSRLAAFAQTVSEQGQGRTDALHCLTRSGDFLDIEISASTLQIEGRSCLLMLVNDVSQYKQLEKALQEAEKKYQQIRQWEEQYHQAQKLEAVGRLTAGIAHDFNNVLTAINGFGELLQAELLPDDPLQEMTDKILRSGRHATDLVRQLLVFSRKQIIEPRRLALNMVVAEMNKMLQRVIGEDIELKTVLTPDLWMVKADPSQMEQVILNLAINARDAMPEGGRLTIETDNAVIDEDYAAGHLGVQPGDYVLLALSDTGYGMSQEVKAHIFEPFFTTKEIGKGTGLGLATVFGIVKQNGGDIWVYSEEGFGTTIKIYLPRAEQATLPLASPEIGAEMPTGDETILLVEDDLAVREVARRVLERQGYTLIEAQRGKEALHLLAQQPGKVHLLLTDVIMPEISGKELSQKATALSPGLKTLFMSGYTDETITHHGVLEPGVAFLQKPFSPIALTRKVRAVLDS